MIRQTVAPRRRARAAIVAATLTASCFHPTPAHAATATWNGLTLNADQTVAPDSNIQILNGLTVNAILKLSSTGNSSGSHNALLDFAGTQTLAGTGQILFDGTSTSGSAYLYPTAGTLTISPGLLIRTSGPGGNGIGNPSLPLVNYATISAQSSGSSIYIEGSPFINYGTLDVRDGGAITVDGSWSNTGQLVVAPGGTLSLAGTYSTSSLAGLSRNAGDLLLGGNLNNASSNLTLSPLTGQLTLTGTIAGGTISTTAGTRLAAAGYAAVLDAVTLNADLDLRGGSLTFRNGASTSPATLIRTTPTTGGTLVDIHNVATISAEHLNQSITLSGAWSNAGTLHASNGGIILLTGNLNPATFGTTISDSGGLVALAGSLNLAGATLTRTGPTASLGIADGASVTNGTLATAAGAQFTLTAAGQSVQFATATLNNVTIAADLAIASRASLLFTTDLTLAGAHISLADLGESTNNGASLLTPTSQSISGTGDISFDGTSGHNSVNSYGGTLTIGPSITIHTGTSSGTVGPATPTGARTVVNYGTLSAQTPGQTLTLTGFNWSNLGTLQSTDNATLNLAGTFSPSSIGTLSVSNGGLANVAGSLNLASSTLNLSASLPLGITTGGNISAGTISSPDATPLPVRGLGATLTSVTLNTPASIGTSAALTFSSSIANQPITVSGANAGLVLSGAWSNNSAITLTSGATLNLGGTPTALGSISLTDSSLYILNTYTAAQLRTITLSNSSVHLGTTGNLVVTGDTLTLDPTTGDLQLAGGRITGGTVASATGRQLLANPASSTILDGVTLAANLTLATGASVSTLNGLTLANAARISLTNDSTFTLSGPSPLAGAGEITFDGVAPLAPSGPNVFNGTPPRLSSTTASTSNLTISPSITVRTNTSGGTVGIPSRPLLNQGTISAQTPSKTLTLTASILTNTGTLAASNHSTLLIDSTSFTNTGTITVDPTATLVFSPTTTPAGPISLAGTMIVNYTTTSPIDTLRAQLLTGSISSPTPHTSVAYAEASQLSPEAASLLAGGPVDATTVILISTPTGDANLNGQLDPDDYALLDRALAKSTPNPHYTDGDFNYDGLINNQDYLLIDQTLYAQSQSFTPDFLAQRESQFGAAYVSTLLASTPEPTSALACLFAIFPLVTRRRQPTRINPS